MNRLFLFVRPPRPMWPFNGPDTGFWPPLAFASLAAALRDALPEIEVRILDAPALQMGWRSLERRLRELQPRWVGLGEEAVSSVEGLRLARLAKAIGAQVVAGGCFYSHVAPQILQSGRVDVVVHGEGEVTLVELVRALLETGSHGLEGIAGISWRDGDAIRHNGHRTLLPDLDQLPWPAFDLLPMEAYGRRSRNHPAFAALEASRGCLDACSFCILWRQMGQRRGTEVFPRLRVKSPDRLLEEVRRLVHGHGRRYVGWVDPCFNAHPSVPGRLAELLLRHDLVLGQSAWMRADALLRDETSGALETLVAAGLNEVYVGLERPDDPGLASVDKRETQASCRRALELLATRYPQVFTVGSFIYGLPGDTPEILRHIYRLSLELPLDKAFFIPLTPLPGTPFWRPELWDGSGEAFRSFNFLPASTVESHFPDLDRALLRCIALDWRPARLRGYWRGFTAGGARKRRITWRLFSRSTVHAARLVWQSVTARPDSHGMLVPAWYED